MAIPTDIRNKDVPDQADEASNNIVFVCKGFYLESHLLFRSLVYIVYTMTIHILELILPRMKYFPTIREFLNLLLSI